MARYKSARCNATRPEIVTGDATASGWWRKDHCIRNDGHIGEHRSSSHWWDAGDETSTPRAAA